MLAVTQAAVQHQAAAAAGDARPAEGHIALVLHNNQLVQAAGQGNGFRQLGVAGWSAAGGRDTVSQLGGDVLGGRRRLHQGVSIDGSNNRNGVRDLQG